MKTILFRMTAAALTCGLAVGASGCSRESGFAAPEDCKPDNTFPTVQGEGTLTVGLTEIPPFSYTKGADAAGVDVDIVEQFALANCLDVTYEPVTYTAAIPSVQDERVDLTIGDWYRTRERTAVVNLSAPLYLDEMGAVSKGITTVDDLKGKAVGTVDGYLWVEDLRKLLGGDLKVYPSSVELKQDLEAGRLDVAIDAYGTALYYFKGSNYKVTTVKPDPAVDATVEPAQTTFPYPKGATELGEALDESIAQLHKSGKMEEILTKHGLPASSADVGKPRLID
jgi:polar amino acid transport system substrate-binding protein